MHQDRDTTEAPRLALIASVAAETEPVLRRLHHMRDLSIGRKPAWLGLLAGSRVVVLQGGMGKSNAAQMLTAALERYPVEGVVGFGVAGGYRRAAVETGGLVLASGEIYGDEGVETAGGWEPTDTIGIPLLETNAGRCFNHIPLPQERVHGASAALTDAGLAHCVGPFVTVSTCSGTQSRGDLLAERFGAVAETMEGAAYAHVAAHYGVPIVEVRGISNQVEDRDLSRWRLAAAAEASARAVTQVVACW